ncbi:aminotransferase class I/II-fold pyridoxal phosphate-dependent enzyme [Patescibacteria group bacterium]|nr:aminotransferase class I/II-fold pyridoxal phosphate-dependent enzyme [Patescibacteria group bacterium]MBU1472788.1 aminotransferase class I/II-fold pyridoxal phosphate-dependent enzyme [Patescibacteria group bacterium]MBU2459737.1 aminotransferase class I/II-fold pyridoxal phosphate-dependent enzyme [Patescibacteria group bacterium]MBU2544407.1 aminotransferase class I/II-fold pyridoxal phosphate-dependent enzyme [Patescibacteria group bacterium]
MTLRRVISSSLSPNTEWGDVLAALRILFSPSRWKNGKEILQIESWFKRRFKTNSAVSFNSGRSALLAILYAFDIGWRDEVLIQVFTCVAVPNSVRWAGAKPVYVDIDETYNIDPKDAKTKISKKTKAIIVQHTFGTPAKMDELLSIARAHNIILIEDCAHALGATYKGKSVGGLGDACFFSFGRDKVVSSVFGGLAIIADVHKKQQRKLVEFRNKLSCPSVFWIARQLLHPIAFSIILPMYTMEIGKVLLCMLQKLKLLSFPVYPEEKKGEKPDIFPSKYPNALACLLLPQLAKLDRYNDRRKKTAEYYRAAIRQGVNITMPPEVQGAIYLRFPAEVPDPDRFHKIAKSNGVLLGNWYHCVIDPCGVAHDAVGYKKGSCPAAEEASCGIINLPTLILPEQAARISYLLKHAA